MVGNTDGFHLFNNFEMLQDLQNTVIIILLIFINHDLTDL